MPDSSQQGIVAITVGVVLLNVNDLYVYLS